MTTLAIPTQVDAVVRRDPYTWGVVDGFFDRDDAARMAQEFPAEGFRVAGTSSKQFLVRSLVVDSRVHSSARELSEVWRSAAQLLASPEYRTRLAELLGLDLGGLRVDASLCRYPPGCSLLPHTDRAIRVATHVAYFNQDWRREWGGMLRVLRSSDLDDVEQEICPTLHTSVVMARSDSSWHAVTPVHEGVREERLSLLAHASYPSA